MSLPLKHILIPGQLVFALSPLYCVHSSEATNTNFIIFGLTQRELESMIYHCRGEHANHYDTDAVWMTYTKRQLKKKHNFKEIIL
jgi:hypothetical protein